MTALPFFPQSILLVLFGVTAFGCTNILVTPGASSDESAMIAYNADAPTLYGVLYHYPATQNNTGTRKVWDWDSGVYLGEIQEADSTYNVVGNSNEHGLMVAETTFGGISLLAWNQTGAVMDYGSLIYITLQRAKTAREAIQVMSSLMDTYGYASGGESFSIADRNGEVWIMEVISTGNDYSRKGAVWVAVKIPDGAIASHANQARIQSFPRDKPDECLYSPDVVDVAVFYGLYPATADPNDFSFSETYCPVSEISARMDEGRVWSIFSGLADTTGDFEKEYEPYVLGKDLSKRMPLYIIPYKKVSLDDVMHSMTQHYEGMALDSTRDVGSGLFETPYRPRPLVWTLENKTYVNERSVATAKSGWNFVGQIRPWMPAPLSALVWFACDDSSTTPRTPVYGSSTKIAPPYVGQGNQDGVVSPLLKLDLKKAFWVQNMVSNFAYYRWKDVYPKLRKKIDKLQNDLQLKVSITDKRALEAYETGNVQEAVKIATKFGWDVGIALHKIWFAFYGELFVTYRDFYIITPKQGEPSCQCEANEPGMSEATKRRIVQETGDHYLVKRAEHSETVFRGERGRPLHTLDNAVTAL